MNKIDPMSVPYFGWWECKVCGGDKHELTTFSAPDDKKGVKITLDCGHTQILYPDRPLRRELPQRMTDCQEGK